MPVLPPVYSTTVPPGFNSPARLAPSMAARANLSFIDPVGFVPSTLATIRAWPSGTTRWSSTSGVFPMVSRTDGDGARRPNGAAGDVDAHVGLVAFDVGVMGRVHGDGVAGAVAVHGPIGHDHGHPARDDVSKVRGGTELQIHRLPDVRRPAPPGPQRRARDPSAGEGSAVGVTGRVLAMLGVVAIQGDDTDGRQGHHALHDARAGGRDAGRI